MCGRAPARAAPVASWRAGKRRRSQPGEAGRRLASPRIIENLSLVGVRVFPPGGPPEAGPPGARKGSSEPGVVPQSLRVSLIGESDCVFRVTRIVTEVIDPPVKDVVAEGEYLQPGARHGTR